MVADGEVCVIWLQSVGGAAEHSAYVKSVVYAGEEVGVVADLHWEVGFSFVFGEQACFLEGWVVFEDLWEGG